MEKTLSAGALTQILEGQKPANPVLQIIGYKPMGPEQTAFGQSSDELRYRLMIHDGIKAHQYCVITNQDLVKDIQSGKIEKWSVVRVTSYHACDTEGEATKRTLLYILNMEIVHKGSLVGQKLTVDPSSIVKPTDSGNHVAAAAAATTNPVRPMIQEYERPNPYGNGHTQAQPYPMQRAHDTPRPIRGSHENQTINISELTPYIGKWVIKGRVTSKSGIREYSNAKGNGKVFSFTLTDKTGEIKCTAFNADCERNFAYIEPNKVYILGRASVKNADKRYSAADFEVTLNSDSLLEEVTDSAAANDIPMAKFNFVSIGSLSSAQPTQPIDLIGAITAVSEVSTVMSKTKNKELKKRNITIVDMSRHSISVTIWGEPSESFTGAVGDVFVTKGARIGTYGGRSASAGDCMFVNPEIPEVRKIKNWYSNLLDQNFTSLTSSQEGQSGGDAWKNLAQLKDMEQAKVAASGGQGGVYAKCKAMLMSVGKNPVYKCCPTDGCGKKLVDTQAGEMKCEKCQQTYTNYKHRFKTDIEIEDNTSSSWVTLWDEKAEMLFGMKPDALERLMKMENKEEYEKIITRPNFKTFIFTLRSRVDTYNNEERVKLNALNISPMDPVSYTKHLIEEIKSLA